LGRPLWREDGSAVCNCYWPSPAQSFSGPSPVGLVALFYRLRFETSLFVAFYVSQGHGGGIRHRLHTGIETRINYVSPFYNFGEDRILVTASDSSSITLCLSVAAGTCDNFLATVWFPHKPIRCWGNVSSEWISNSELFRLSGVMSQYMFQRFVNPLKQNVYCTYQLL
jgi:hypothetical protein